MNGISLDNCRSCGAYCIWSWDTAGVCAKCRGCKPMDWSE